ncbi:MAG: hypothetical protein ABIH11_00410 [Candidatus Altiarchaeota archaeon]
MTYSDLERIYRLEKNSTTLQEITEDFFSQAAQLVESPEVAQHRDYIKDILNEVYERRRTKILLHAARTLDKPENPKHATINELELYRRIISMLAENHRIIFDHKPMAEKPVDVEKKRVRLLQAIPVIVGPDAVEYGPFKADDVVELPVESAGILLKQGVAEDVHVE